MVSGTSSGSLAAASWVAGQVDDLIGICMTLKNNHVFKPAPLNAMTSKASILDNEPLGKLIFSFLDFDKIRHSSVPCYANSTNLKTWNVQRTKITDVLLRDEEIVDALVASTAVPMAFPPSGDLVDGGVIDNYPMLDLYEQGADRIILMTAAVNEGSVRIDNVFDMISSTLSIQSYYQLTSSLEILKLVKNPPEIILIQPTKPTGIKLLDFDGLGNVEKRRGYIQLGYDLARAQLEKIAPNAVWSGVAVPEIEKFRCALESDFGGDITPNFVL